MQKDYQKLANDHAGNIGETARRMKEFETGAPELFSQVNNIKDASGKNIDIFMHVSNTFTAGAFGYTGYTYNDNRDKSGNGLVTIGNNSFYGNNVTVTVNQTPTNDGTLGCRA